MKAITNFFASLKEPRIGKGSWLEVLRLTWLLIVLFTLIALLGILWYAINDFNNWSEVENNISVEPPAMVDYDDKEADKIFEFYDARAKALDAAQGKEVEVVTTPDEIEKGEVRAGS